MMSEKKRPSINLSIFTNLSESFSSDHGSKSPNSPLDFKSPTKSPRNFEAGVVGLGIVAAMNEMNNTHEAFSCAKTSRAAKIALSPKSQPIQIVSAKPVAKFREPILEKDEMELGDKAFCSAECRCQQILTDELKEKCGSGALKPFDYSVSPCSAPRLFSAGVVAA
ncbi:hypothetical protein HHK36_013458 [Tetracentron sinense]|uniref:FLZ-type domain-containing protein n=1 Tax=Tetracentron sinense TaxID=13715 RepID=A0A834ZDK5_TETSI|nr:hypothetical protein HHK36_013458 [Tetracentron sinense]